MNFFFILLFVLSIILIVVITLQPSKGEGLGSIGGGGQLFFGKSKGFEAFMDKLTAGLGIAFFLIAIIAQLLI